jgi:hypothetical protein
MVATSGLLLPDLSHSNSPAVLEWYEKAKLLAEEGWTLGQAPQQAGSWQEPAYGPNSSWPEGLAPVWEPERPSRRQEKRIRRGLHMGATKAAALLRGSSPERSPPLPDEVYPIWEEQDPAEDLLPCWEYAEAETMQAPVPAPGPGLGCQVARQAGGWIGPIPKGSGMTRTQAGGSTSKKKMKKKGNKKRKRLNADQRKLTAKGIRRAGERAHMQWAAPGSGEDSPASPGLGVEDTGEQAASSVVPPVMVPPPLAVAGESVIKTVKAE